MPLSEILLDFAKKHDIEIIVEPCSDTCDLTISYTYHISFSDFLNKQPYASELIQISRSGSTGIFILGPTFKDLSTIEESEFFSSCVSMYKKLMEIFPNATELFKRELIGYLGRKTNSILNVCLVRHNNGQFRNYFFGNEGGRLQLRCLNGTSHEIFVKKPELLKDLAEAIRKAKVLCDEYFLKPNNPERDREFEKVLPEIKELAQISLNIQKHKEEQLKLNIRKHQGFFDTVKISQKTENQLSEAKENIENELSPNHPN